MGKCDKRYTLGDMVELNEEIFTAEVPDSEKVKPLKKGCSSHRKTRVLVMAETMDGNPTKKEHTHTAVKHIKKIVVNDLEAETLYAKFKGSIVSSSNIISNHSTSYTKVKSIVANHRSWSFRMRGSGKSFPGSISPLAKPSASVWMSSMTSAPIISRTTSASFVGGSTANILAMPCSTGWSWPGGTTKTSLGIDSTNQ